MSDKKSSMAFLAKAMPLTICLSLGAYYLTDRYSIGIDPQENTCLEWRVFIVDKHDQVVERGGIYSFSSRSMEPHFKNGTTIIKVADGVPGDRVQVSLEQVTVNGEIVGQGLLLSDKLKKPKSRYARDEFVPKDHYWFMGKTSDSFDSRYWGYVAKQDIIGKAYPVW